MNQLVTDKDSSPFSAQPLFPRTTLFHPLLSLGLHSLIGGIAHATTAFALWGLKTTILYIFLFCFVLFCTLHFGPGE